MITTEFGVFSQKGRSHQFNEDRYRILGDQVARVRDAGRGHLYAVADGASRAEFGMKAAQHLVGELLNFYDATTEPSVQGLRAIVEKANNEVYAWGADSRGLPKGAAAFTIAWLTPESKVVLLHAGDTVAISFDGSTAKTLTPPAPGGPLAHFLGQGPWLELTILECALDEGDTLALFSDGVGATLTPEEIGAEILRHADMNGVAKALVSKAAAKSADDLTALIIELQSW